MGYRGITAPPIITRSNFKLFDPTCIHLVDYDHLTPTSHYENQPCPT